MLKYLLTLFALTGLSLQEGEDEDPNTFIRPIMYGVSIGLALTVYGVLAWIYQADSERDPMIYSKYLTVKKNK